LWEQSRKILDFSKTQAWHEHTRALIERHVQPRGYRRRAHNSARKTEGAAHILFVVRVMRAWDPGLVLRLTLKSGRRKVIQIRYANGHLCIRKPICGVLQEGQPVWSRMPIYRDDRRDRSH